MLHATADKDPFPPSAREWRARASADRPASGNRFWAKKRSDDNPSAWARCFFSGWIGKIGTGSKPVNERAGGENGARPRGILGDLGFESVKARELLLGPDEIDERDAQVSPVKVHIG